MLFGRKLGLHRPDGAVELFSSFERICSSLSKTLPSASLLEGSALLKIWQAVLPFSRYFWSESPSRTQLPSNPPKCPSIYQNAPPLYVCDSCIVRSMLCVAMAHVLHIGVKRNLVSEISRSVFGCCCFIAQSDTPCLALQVSYVAWRPQHPAVNTSKGQT